MKSRWISFKEIGDEDGMLIALEQLKEIPFELKRMFYIYALNQEVIRGNHANRNSNFLMIAIKGLVKVEVDDGSERVEYLLDSLNKGLFVEKMTWKKMYEFSQDAILLVLSDQYYDSGEYITDYEVFKNTILGRDKNEN